MVIYFSNISEYSALSMTIGKARAFTSGVNIEIRLHSASGQEYPRSLTLP